MKAERLFPDRAPDPTEAGPGGRRGLAFAGRLGVLLACLVSAGPLPAAPPLEVFSGRFPLTLQFRGVPVPAGADAPEDMARYLDAYNGRTDKFLAEEMNRSPEHAERYRRWKAAHPGKMLLVHLNGEARAVWPPEVHRRYFPGHWVYYPGSPLAAPVRATDDRIQVADTRPFAGRKFGNTDEDGSEHGRDVLLVELDAAGRRQWDRSEYARVTRVDAASGTLVLQRGQHGTAPREFPAASTYVAPLVSGFWGGHVMWFYNLSSVCPRDAGGRTAADHFLDEIGAWFSPTGVLSGFDGIGFDVNYFKTKWPGFDVDNDGVADDGLAKDGRNLWREGDWDFLRRLRQRMGEDFVITADGWKEQMQMAAGVLTGIESEGLVAPADGWRLFARTLNVQTYWAEHNDRTRTFSYITGKLRHPVDLARATSLRRLGAATACSLGVAYTDSDFGALRADRIGLLPELTLGTRAAGPWLGRPVGPMVVPVRAGPDLYGGAGVRIDTEFVRSVTVANGRIVEGAPGEIRIVGTATSPHDAITVRLPPIAVAQGEVVLLFEARAIDPLPGFRPEDRVPRQIGIHAEGLPRYDRNPRENGLFNGTMALMGTKRFTRQYAYLRRAAQGGGRIDITLTIEGNGAFALRDVVAGNGPLTLGREFENGVVLANASEGPVRFDLGTMFSPELPRQLRRILLTPDLFADARREEVQDMLRTNDGSALNGLQVEIPGLDGLFLCKSR